MDKVRAAGGDALPGAQDATRADNPEQAARYAVTPAACYEAVALAKKRGRAEREAGETPFEILGRAVSGEDRQAAAWWRDYVAGTKGKRQVTVSRGLKLAGDDDLVAEGEAEEARAPDADALVALAPRELDRTGRWPELLGAAEDHAGDPDAGRAAVAGLLASLPEGNGGCCRLAGRRLVPAGTVHIDNPKGLAYRADCNFRHPFMDWKTFIVRLVEAVAWPTVAAFAFWYGRDRISGLFDRLVKVKGLGAEAEFSKQLDQVAEKIPVKTPDQVGDTVTASGTVSAEVVREAELPPDYIVQKAWERVEKALRSSAEKMGVSVPFVMQRVDTRTLHDLRALRNKAVHGGGHEISLTDALRYRDLADRLMQQIEAVKSDRK